MVLQAQAAVAQSSKSLALSLDEILTRRHVRAAGPGVQVVIVSPNEILYEGAIGLANPVVDASEMVTTSHQANLYSLSKFFTAGCLLKLIEDGKLCATDKVRDYLPMELQKLVTNECTIEHLVAHVGGAPNPLPLQWVHSPDETVDEMERLVSVLQRNPLKTLPEGGLPYQYSNIGYWILGHVVTTACNVQPSEFARCCQDLLFSAIENEEAQCLVSDQFSLDTPMMYGHIPRWSILALVARLACPSGIIGPTSGSWVRMEPHLLDGTSYGGLIGSTRSVSTFLQAFMNRSILDSINPLFTPLCGSKMTFGLHARPHRGVRIYHKEGGGAGCHSSIQFRNQELAGCIIAGDATFNVNELLDELMDCIEDHARDSKLVVPGTKTVMAKDGVRLYTKRYSSDDTSEASLLVDGTILLISGGPGVPDYLEDVASLLISCNIASSVLSFDQRGTGKSRLPADGQISIDLLLEDIYSIQKAYNLGKIHVLGHSWGGVLAQLYAQKFPNHCSSLVLLSPTTVWQGSDWSKMETEVMKYNQRKAGWWKFAKMGFWSLLMRFPFVSDYATGIVMAQVMRNYYYDPPSAPEPPAAFLNAVSARATILSRNSFISQVNAPISWDANKIPSCCVFGDEDIYGQPLVESFCDTFKGTTSILQQCSHLSWIDQPRRLETLLRSFYSGIV